VPTTYQIDILPTGPAGGDQRRRLLSFLKCAIDFSHDHSPGTSGSLSNSIFGILPLGVCRCGLFCPILSFLDFRRVVRMLRKNKKLRGR
jgi:hypothetical protein